MTIGETVRILDRSKGIFEVKRDLSGIVSGVIDNGMSFVQISLRSKTSSKSIGPLGRLPASVLFDKLFKSSTLD